MTDYVALQPIDHGNARAYNPGDTVPAANVEANEYAVGEQVAERDSDEARAVLAGLGMLPADQPDSVVEAADETAGPAGEEYDPSAHTVDEVNAWLDEHPDQVRAVLRAEWDGKSRAGIVHGRHGEPPNVAES